MGYLVGASVILIVFGLVMIRFNARIEKFVEDALIFFYGERLMKRFMKRTGKEAGFIMVLVGLGILGWVIYLLATGRDAPTFQ